MNEINRDKRNPDIIVGDRETSQSYTRRIGDVLSKLEWQSDGHRQWYTHKNPYSCWICEIFQVSRQLHDILLDEYRDEGTDADEDGYIDKAEPD